MAEHHLTFRIGSTFSGEGFRQAQNTVNRLTGPVKASAVMLSQMGSAMGGLDSSAARATGALTAILQSVMTLSGPMLILQGAIMAVTFVLNKLKEKSEEQKKAAEELARKMEESFNDALAKRIGEITGKMQELTGDFDRLTRQANEFNAALSGVAAANDSGGVIALEVQKLNALLEAHTEAERQSIEATFNLAIAKERAKVSTAAAEREIAAANKNLSDNINKRSNITNRLTYLESEIAKLEEENKQNVDEAGKLNKRGIAIQKEIDALKKEESKLIRERQDLAAAAMVQELKVKEQQIKLENASKAAEKSIKEVELQNKKQAEAAEALAAKTAAAAGGVGAAGGASGGVADAAATYKAKLEEAAAAQKEVNAGKAALKQAEAAYAAALGNFNRDFANNNLFGQLAGMDNKQGGMVRGFDPAALKNIEAQNVAHALADALAAGEVRSVKDFQRRERELQRQERDRTNAAKNVANNERARYDRLKKQNPKTLSDADRKFMDDFEQVNGANQKPLNDLQAARENLEKMKESLDDLVEKFEDLGLK